MGKLSSILICLALAVSIGILSYNYRETSSDHHQSVMEIVSSLKNLNHLLNNEIMRTRLKPLTNYDQITALASQGHQIITELENKNLEIDQNTPLEVSLKKYTKIFSEKMAYTESFKAKNSIVRNSLHFLPHISRELRNKLIQSGSSNQIVLVVEVSELLNLILTDSLSFDPDQSQSKIIRTEIKKLEGKLSTLPADTRKSMETFILHAGIVNNNLDELKLLTANILDMQSIDLEKDLILKIDQYVSHQKDKARSLFRWLTLVSVCLLIYVVINLIHLSRKASAIRTMNENLESKVRQRTEELEQSSNLIADQQKKIFHASKLSAIGEMAGGIAHEINNPVTILMGKLGELRELNNEGWDQNNASELIDKSEATLWRITKIIRGLRSFSRETSNEEMELKSLHSLVHETLDFCTEKFKKNGIVLEIDEIPDSAVILCRPTQVAQVLLNLLNNANDALETIESKKIKISFQDLGDSYSLAIRDNGSGIPHSLQEKIFLPFFTTKEQGKGTGLGLSISKGIIESHKGELILRSRPGETAFICQFPKIQREVHYNQAP